MSLGPSHSSTQRARVIHFDHVFQLGMLLSTYLLDPRFVLDRLLFQIKILYQQCRFHFPIPLNKSMRDSIIFTTLIARCYFIEVQWYNVSERRSEDCYSYDILLAACWLVSLPVQLYAISLVDLYARYRKANCISILVDIGTATKQVLLYRVLQTSQIVKVTMAGGTRRWLTVDGVKVVAFIANIEFFHLSQRVV